MQASPGELRIDAGGIVEGPALEAAQAELEGFYKHDEAYAFNLWASPAGASQLLVLYELSLGAAPERAGGRQRRQRNGSASSPAPSK